MTLLSTVSFSESDRNGVNGNQNGLKSTNNDDSSDENTFRRDDSAEGSSLLDDSNVNGNIHDEDEDEEEEEFGKSITDGLAFNVLVSNFTILCQSIAKLRLIKGLR